MFNKSLIRSAEQSAIKISCSKELQPTLTRVNNFARVIGTGTSIIYQTVPSDISIHIHKRQCCSFCSILFRYIHLYVRTRIIFLGAFFPLRYFHPISQACHFLAKLVSVCGQKGARSDVCVRFHNGTPTSMASRLAALCMQTENVSSPSMTDRGGR